MQLSGYKTNYRKHILKQGLGIFDSMVKNNIDGMQPVNTPTDWNRGERLKKKSRTARIQHWPFCVVVFTCWPTNL